MKNKMMLAATALMLGLTGCVEHEIIPAPIPHVELECHFTGLVNGTDVELTQNVSGYYLSTTKAKTILPSPAPSSATYYSNIKSDQSLTSIQVGLGSVNWDSNLSADPTIAMFNTFFTSNTNPAYSTDAESGFEVQYRDAAGNVWISKPADAGQSVSFSNIIQESDGSGDYSKFSCNFTSKVYHTFMITTVDPNTGQVTITPNEQNIIISNGIFKGWFQR